MARLARIVVPGLPHHVTRRGNGRAKVQGVFHVGRLRALQAPAGRALPRRQCRHLGMVPDADRAHLILTSDDPAGLRRAPAEVHRAYAGIIHARQKKSGHFWQGRFGTVVMDEDHLLSAMRYVGLNPVRAGLVKQATDWPWSSARAHLAGEPDGVTDLEPMTNRLPSPAGLFDLVETDAAAFDALRKAESIGRPVGSETFQDRISDQTGRVVKPGKRGRRHEKSALSP